MLPIYDPLRIAQEKDCGLGVDELKIAQSHHAGRCRQEGA